MQNKCRKKIYCCGCKKDVACDLITGLEAYPYSPNLAQKRFYQCDKCKNFVGVHNKKRNGAYIPLGVIATKEIKNARQHIHKFIDPLWKSKKITRGDLYSAISKKIGKEYHTAEIRSVEEAREIYKICLTLKSSL